MGRFHSVTAFTFVGSLLRHRRRRVSPDKAELNSFEIQILLLQRKSTTFQPTTINGDLFSLSMSDNEEARRTPLLMYLMTYMFPGITVGFVILKYHDNPDKVFVDNVVPLWCFIASTVVYWLIAEVMKKSTLNSVSDWFLALHFAALASGLLSLLSQISLIFLTYPDSHVPLLIWIPMPVIFVFWPISHYTYDTFLCGRSGGLKTEQVYSSPV